MGFSVFTDILIKELGLSRVELSLAYCLGTVASGFSLPWLGRVLDRWGERKMAVASIVTTGVVLLFLANSVQLSSSLAQVLPSGIAAFLVIGVGFFLAHARIDVLDVKTNTPIITGVGIRGMNSPAVMQ